MCVVRFDVLGLLFLGSGTELPSRHATVACLLAMASALQPTNPAELPAAAVEPDTLLNFTGLTRFNRAMRSWHAYLSFPEVRDATLDQRTMLLMSQIP